jgi:hypothetical protein
MTRALLLAVAAMALAACGEKPQVLGGTLTDTKSFEGTGTSFSAPGWKAGDKSSWEAQLRTRMQNGQNEYNKVN